ncbi:MAG: lamin tail domain-containing protein [Paludibacteraceae bacterium]
MKKSVVLLLVFFPFFIFSQNTVEWKEDFSDGNFTANPKWIGTNDNFIVNSSLQLQSKAPITSKSYLSTSSEIFDNAVWEFWVKINYNPTSSNYASVYLIADRADLSNEVYGYYVQIGNTSDEISLYLQEGSKKTKIIDGTDGRTNSNPAEVRVKVVRDKDGNFMLYSKLPSDTDFYSEGSTQNLKVSESKFFGMLYSNSSLTGNAYFFDDISVIGEKFVDVIPPVWTNLMLVEPNKLILTFSEPVDLSAANFQIDSETGSNSGKLVSADNLSVELTFNVNFEKGRIYTVEALNVKDLAGNLMENTQRQAGIIEKTDFGDLIINEILFEPAANGPEYFEVFNKSSKVLDLSTVTFGTRKTDGSYTPANFFPSKTLILPGKYLALTQAPEIIRNTYIAPDTANILYSDKWTSLSNTNAGFLITNQNGDSIYDEVNYDIKWHHPLIKDTQGVSLERINPSLPSQSPESWHSAASEVHYGTPGYKNSQFRDIISYSSESNRVWLEPEVFTPDNDGIDDVAFIRYKTESVGFTANVIVFNSIGVKIKQIAANTLLATDGILTWDGKTDREQNVNPGIYVLYFEMINAEKGVKKIEKLPLVVSAR